MSETCSQTPFDVSSVSAVSVRPAMHACAWLSFFRLGPDFPLHYGSDHRPISEQSQHRLDTRRRRVGVRSWSPKKRGSAPRCGCALVSNPRPRDGSLGVPPARSPVSIRPALRRLDCSPAGPWQNGPGLVGRSARLSPCRGRRDSRERGFSGVPRALDPSATAAKRADSTNATRNFGALGVL